MNKLLLYINNSKEIYELSYNLQKAIEKKILKGIEPDPEKLSQSQAMKRIIREGIKEKLRYNEPTTAEERKEAAIIHATQIIERASYANKVKETNGTR